MLTFESHFLHQSLHADLSTTGVCADTNSSPNTSRSTIEYQCVYHSSDALFSRAPRDIAATCICNTGFEYAKRPNNDRYCKG